VPGERHAGTRQPVGQVLRALPVSDAGEGVVGCGEADALRGQLPSLPAVAVAVELQAERRSYGNPQGIRPSSGIVTVTGSGGEIAHGQQ